MNSWSISFRVRPDLYSWTFFWQNRSTTSMAVRCLSQRPDWPDVGRTLVSVVVNKSALVLEITEKVIKKCSKTRYYLKTCFFAILRLLEDWVERKPGVSGNVEPTYSQLGHLLKGSVFVDTLLDPFKTFDNIKRQINDDSIGIALKNNRNYCSILFVSDFRWCLTWIS